MEWHVACAFLLALGVFFPWALVPAAIGVIYTVGYCFVCARQAKLDVLEATDGPSTWRDRMKWRTTIAFLNFLEPVARDWGRLKGGLTPWRTVTPEVNSPPLPSVRWKRLVPLKRTAKWAIPGTMELEKYSFLTALFRKFAARGCAIGWNKHSEHWDVKFRRGALGVGRLHMVVEHHGGDKRKARFAVSVAPPSTAYWVFGMLAVLAIATALLGFPKATVLLVLAIAILWFAIAAEASRLEGMAVSSAAEAARHLRLWYEKQAAAAEKEKKPFAKAAEERSA
jgi:hypothetical protein